MQGDLMDLSDKAMAERWGHIINEVPELWDALRLFELQNRPVKGGFKIGGDAGVSMNGGAAGSELRIRVGRA
jgi:hypothetical protein